MNDSWIVHTGHQPSIFYAQHQSTKFSDDREKHQCLNPQSVQNLLKNERKRSYSVVFEESTLLPAGNTPWTHSKHKKKNCIRWRTCLAAQTDEAVRSDLTATVTYQLKTRVRISHRVLIRSLFIFLIIRGAGAAAPASETPMQVQLHSRQLPFVLDLGHNIEDRQFGDLKSRCSVFFFLFFLTVAIVTIYREIYWSCNKNLHLSLSLPPPTASVCEKLAMLP